MSNQTILVAEDSPAQLRMVLNALDGQGYQIVTATDGEDALHKAATLMPKLAVLDIVMPKMNGFQVLRRLKTGDDTKDIKVILLSSKDAASDKFWGMKQGADEYLTKPFVEQELAATVKRLL